MLIFNHFQSMHLDQSTSPGSDVLKRSITFSIENRENIVCYISTKDRESIVQV